MNSIKNILTEFQIKNLNEEQRKTYTKCIEIETKYKNAQKTIDIIDKKQLTYDYQELQIKKLIKQCQKLDQERINNINILNATRKYYDDELSIKINIENKINKCNNELNNLYESLHKDLSYLNLPLQHDLHPYELSKDNILTLYKKDTPIVNLDISDCTVNFNYNNTKPNKINKPNNDDEINLINKNNKYCTNYIIEYNFNEFGGLIYEWSYIQLNYTKYNLPFIKNQLIHCYYFSKYFKLLSPKNYIPNNTLTETNKIIFQSKIINTSNNIQYLQNTGNIIYDFYNNRLIFLWSEFTLDDISNDKTIFLYWGQQGPFINIVTNEHFSPCLHRKNFKNKHYISFSLTFLSKYFIPNTNDLTPLYTFNIDFNNKNINNIFINDDTNNINNFFYNKKHYDSNKNIIINNNNKLKYYILNLNDKFKYSYFNFLNPEYNI